MHEDYYAGITRFVEYWTNNSASLNTQMAKQTYHALIREARAENDAVIDAAKAMVECACRILIEVVEGKETEKLIKTNIRPENLLGKALTCLKIDSERDQDFAMLMNKHHEATKALRDFRNSAGPLSHGRNGFVSSLSPYHRRGAVITADAIIIYIHEIYLNLLANSGFEKEAYEHFENDHCLIDGSIVFKVVDYDVETGSVNLEIQLSKEEKLPLTTKLSEILFVTDREMYVQVLDAARLVDKKEDK